MGSLASSKQQLLHASRHAVWFGSAFTTTHAAPSQGPNVLHAHAHALQGPLTVSQGSRRCDGSAADRVCQGCAQHVQCADCLTDCYEHNCCMPGKVTRDCVPQACFRCQAEPNQSLEVMHAACSGCRAGTRHRVWRQNLELRLQPHQLIIRLVMPWSEGQ